MKHNLVIKPNAHSLCVRIACHECEEPEDTGYTWIDDAGDVFFDGDRTEHLILFLAHHDAFGLTAMREAAHADVVQADD